jgi:hypothetical protein
MSRRSWAQVMMAAASILLAGVVQALAEEATGERVRDQQVVVDVNGAVQTIGLEELADGESRELSAGEHSVTVTRHGDRLEVLLDGKELMGEVPAALGGKAVTWVGEEGDGKATVKHVVVMKGADGAPGEPRTVFIATREGEGEEELTVEVRAVGDAEWTEADAAGGKHTMIFTSAEPGSEPVVVAAPGLRTGMVRYRCEASGSELLVEKDKATADSYVCPATGCVMTRVAEPELRVIKVIKKVEADDAEPTE